jgi:hypothetical protein
MQREVERGFVRGRRRVRRKSGDAIRAVALDIQ